MRACLALLLTATSGVFIKRPASTKCSARLDFGFFTPLAYPVPLIGHLLLESLNWRYRPERTSDLAPEFFRDALHLWFGGAYARLLPIH